MDTLGLWVAPFLLMPAKGLLAISASAQYNQQLVLHSSANSAASDRRLGLLRWALTCLYLGIVADASGALIGGLLTLLQSTAVHFMVVATCIGVCFLLAAALFLVAEMRIDPLAQPSNKNSD